ncbi:RNA-directed DNA polymerase, eukaryota [Tanacetum coccineum]
MLKKVIRTWTMEFKSQQVGHTRDLKLKLSDLDKKLNQGGASDDIFLSRLEVMKQLHDVQTSNHRDVMQKAKVRWTIEGDENPKYFHAIINKKRANLSVKGVMVDGDWIDDPFQVSKLQSPISIDEIRTAVWGCGVDKSPGPDGFTFELFRKFWTVVGPDFCTAVKWFFDHGNFSIGCNSSFVALIPKVLDPKVVNDYRPISLIGFGAKWRSWIRGSLSSGKASILVNGSPTSEFHLHRGLKQGDPLAPFLFLLIMEALHLSFSQAVEAGIFTSIKIDPTITLSHLFYADDAVFIGMSINIQKSHLLGVGISENYVVKAAKSIGCSIMKTPFRYLGILVGDNMSSNKAWDETITKMKKRLSKWKLNTLSIGGRLTLLKSVLGSTPIYNMSIFKVPKSILNQMERLRRNFFNGVQDGDRKIAWVKWSKVLASKKFGGLGVSSFFALNRALLFKWVWRYLSQDNSLWFRVIAAIHGSIIHPLSAAYNSIWSSIIKEDLSVADKINAPITSSFRRPIRGGIESQQLDQLLVLLDSVILSNMEDRWFWDLNDDGVFQVKDVRNLLDEAFLPKVDVPTRWIKSIPIKVNVFAWKLFFDRLPTRSNLARRNVNVPSLECPLCSHATEDSSHLFFGCSVAKDVLKLICRWWDLDFHDVDSYDGWLSWFKSIRLGSKSKDVLEDAFYVSWWRLWYYRNELLFAVSKPRKSFIFDDIVLRSFNWCVARGNRTLSWVSWLQHPHLLSL